MSQKRQSRRDFLKTSTLAAAAGTVPYWFRPGSRSVRAADSPNERPLAGCIGTGSRWDGVGPAAMEFADVIAVCDVDANHAEKARSRVKEKQSTGGRSGDVAVHEDYRKLLEDPSIDIVTIVTPDHWHTKIAIDAMRAGKDVYCEKPLTLTIDEGKQIIKVLEETGRVFQVGTQQRSEMDLRFLKAIAMIRDGRIGDVQRVQCAIGGVDSSGPIAAVDPPKNLNWDMWLGQAPKVPYRFEQKKTAEGKDWTATNCHYEFRWWYEYSGGKMTDWGAHHVDIAQWGIGMDQSGPVSVEGTAKHPVPYEHGYPTLNDQYNVATEFYVTCVFPNGVEMVIRHDTDNGVLFEGTKGRLFVSRSKLTGKPVEDLETNPLPEDAITKLYKGKEPGSHMRNFIECVKSREQPISDVWTHHRAMTTCHLANIAIRLGRKITWDPETQQIVGDDEARLMQAREQRKGYEIDVTL